MDLATDPMFPIAGVLCYLDFAVLRHDLRKKRSNQNIAYEAYSNFNPTATQTYVCGSLYSGLQMPRNTSVLCDGCNNARRAFRTGRNLGKPKKHYFRKCGSCFTHHFTSTGFAIFDKFFIVNV